LDYLTRPGIWGSIACCSDDQAFVHIVQVIAITIIWSSLCVPWAFGIREIVHVRNAPLTLQLLRHLRCSMGDAREYAGRDSNEQKACHVQPP
jgi:hypothetical protein